MYESHFGITGPPFQLSADPAFYFDSQSHRTALLELRRGLTTPKAVVVVSGEIGAGKTLLVRTVLAELGPTQITVAQIVSSQLDAAELLLALVAAFGIPAGDQKPVPPETRLATFLSSLADQGRRAVLIVDEAQNLALDALELLGRLIDLGPATAPHLQLCLIGQPELRALMDTPHALPLRLRLGASCHLGPLDDAETRAYIEHRLSKVGWVGRPRFDAGAYAEIHRWTFGIPRRINLLCNRLMLTLYLASQAHVDAAIVARTARDLRAEVGDAELPFDVPSAVPETTAFAPAAGSDRAVAPRGVSRQARVRRQLRSVDAAPDDTVDPAGPWLLVAASRMDCIKFVPMLAALAAQADAPVAKLVCATGADEIDWTRGSPASLGSRADRIDLQLPAGTPAQRAAELSNRFDLVVAEYRPAAVLVMDGSEAALACGLVANRRRIPVAHIGAGVRSGDRSEPAEVTRILNDQLAGMLYVSDSSGAAHLQREGIDPERVQIVGNPLVDTIQAAMAAMAGDDPGSWRHMLRGLQADRHGYGLVVLQEPSTLDDRRNLGQSVLLLRDISRDMPLLWPLAPSTQQKLDGFGLGEMLEGERVARIAPRVFEDLMPLLADATCVVTDAWAVQEAATSLGVPCLTIGSRPASAVTVSEGSNTCIGYSSTLATRAVWEIIFNGGKRGTNPASWDGRASTRIVGHFVKWLATTLVASSAKSGTARAGH